MAAFPGAGLGDHALVQLRRQAVGQAWALLAVGLLGDLGLDRASLHAEFGDRVRLEHLAAACACCTGGPVLTVSLNRLLRSGDVGHMLILADARSHLEGLCHGLEAALARHLPSGSAIERMALMTPTQAVLLEDPGRAGHEAALALRVWAGGQVTFIGRA